MPYTSESVPAEVFVTHKGITIYHTYKNDDIEQGPRDYHFVLNSYDNENESFDVRDMAGWKEPPHPPFLTGEGNTPENQAAWEKYHNNDVLRNYTKSFLIQQIEQGTIHAKEE